MSAAGSLTGIGLELEFEFNAVVKPPVTIGTGPFGTRMFFETVEGTVTGERISGRVLPGGGDWLLLGGDGWGRLDARAQLETDDGAFIYAYYSGVVEMNDAVQQGAESGNGTDYDDQYMRALIHLETGDPRYDWVNHAVFVYQGRFASGGGVAARIYRVT